MLESLPQYQSMKRAHRVRRFRASNAEHTQGRWRPGTRKGKVHNPYHTAPRFRQETAAA